MGPDGVGAYNMKILFYLSKSSYYSGSTRLILAMQSFMDPMVFNRRIIFGVRGIKASNIKRGLNKSKIKFTTCYVLPKRLTQFWFFRFLENICLKYRIKRIFDGFVPDIFYSNVPDIPQFVIKHAKTAGKYYHLSLQISKEGIKGIRQTQINTFNQANGIIAGAEILKRGLIKSGVSPTLIQTVHDSIVPCQINAQLREQYRAKFGFSESDIVVCASGPVSVRKGTDLFIRMAEQISSTPGTENVKFLWVGGGSCIALEDNKAPETIGDLLNKLGDRLYFTGMVDHPYDYFQAVDLFVMCSRSECIPLAMLASMSLEKPVVAFNNSGIPEALNGRGVLVDTENVDALVDNVLGLISNKDERKRLGEQCRDEVCKNFDIREKASHIETILLESL